MEKIIKIGKTEVKLGNNVAWTMEYRDQFGRDIVPALMPILTALMEGTAAVLSESGGGKLTAEAFGSAIEGKALDILLPLYQVEFVDLVVNVTWAMAKAADEDIDPPKKWVRQFKDGFPVDVVVPAVYELVTKGFVSSKNLKRLRAAEKNLKNLQPLLSTTSSSPESNED